MPFRTLNALENTPMFDELEDFPKSQLSPQDKEFIVVQIATQIDRLSLKKLAMVTKQLTRQEKIKYIENELYRRAMEEEISIEELIKIHRELFHADDNERLTDIQENSSLPGFLNQLVNTGFYMLLLATAVSLIALKPCKNSQSPFCKSAKIIPEFVQNIFKEPAPMPKSKILPTNLP